MPVSAEPAEPRHRCRRLWQYPWQPGNLARGAAVVAQVFSGASIGLLLGLLVGLSTSPVVALVVGALAALLSAVVLPQAKGGAVDTTPTRQLAAAWRSGALGLAAIVGLTAGLWLRTHDALSPPRPTLAQQVAAVQAAGFGAEEARRLVASREFPAAHAALAPTGAAAAAATADHRSSVLFSADASSCERLAPSRFKNVAVAAAAYEAAGFAALADFARSLANELADESQRKVALVAVVGATCAAR